jgi:arabinogalactan oligomer/maltooligosaccharide transport system substrate-binding protein
MDTKAAVVVTGPWNTNACQAALGDDYAVAKLPCFTVDDETFQIGSYSGCKLMCVKPQTDREKLVLCNAIANYLSGEECSLERFTEFKWGPSNKAAQASDEVQADLALAAIADQAQYATPQGNIFDGWWTIGGEIAINAKKTDGSDAALREVLVTYEEALADALDLYKKGPQALLVGKWNGWNNADAEYIMTYDEDLGTWTFELTVDDSLAYKGGRIVEAASWNTIANWDNVDEDSLVYLDEAYDPETGANANGDKNLVFKEGGKYLITYDEVTETITIEEA